MTRHQFLGTVVFLVAVLPVSSRTIVAGETGVRVAQPNIILIVSDDQGYPDLGCIGSEEKPDVLARVKARFDAWKKEMDAAEPRGPFRDY